MNSKEGFYTRSYLKLNSKTDLLSFKHLDTLRGCLSFAIMLLLLFFSAINLHSSGTKMRLDDYLIKTWTVQTGLPQNTVVSLVQTFDDYIWIGTSSGLLRFDGVKFKTFTRQNSPLRTDRIACLFEDVHRVLWIGTTGGGLCSYDAGTWKNYTQEDGLSHANIRAITGDWQGNLWVGTDYGLNCLIQDSIRTYTTDDGLYDNIITSLTMDVWGNLWVGTLRGGLAMFNEGIIAVYDYDGGLRNPSVLSVAADHTGNLWIGTLEGLYFLRGGEGIVWPVIGTLYSPVTSVCADRHGIVWMGTMGHGLKRIMADSSAALSTEKGLPDDCIRCLMMDREDSIWIGTDKGGLVHLTEPRIKNFGRENGLPEDAVNAVLEDRRGFLWVGTRNRGLCRMRGDRVIDIFTKENGLPGDRVRALFEDSQGGLWIGTEEGGLSVLREGRFFKITPERDLPSVTQAFLETREGIFWAGTNEGLFQVQEGKVRKIRSPRGVENYVVNVLLEARDGSLLIGTNEGLFRLSEGSMSRVKLAEGDTDIEVLSLYEDGGGFLWIGTSGRGLLRWTEDRMISLTTEEGLRDNSVFSIIEDSDKNLWVSSSKGVTLIRRADLEAYDKGEASLITPVFFDEHEGMKSSLCAGQSQSAVCLTGSGRILYPTAKGVAVFDPADLHFKNKPPTVILEEVAVDDLTYPVNQAPEAFPRHRMLEFHFTALDFAAPEKLRFVFRLEGYDRKSRIVPVETERTARYLNLKPGNYRFFVRAANNDGVWNDTGDSFAFEVLFSFYQRPAFYLLIVLAGGAAVGITVYRKRLKKQKKLKDKYKTLSMDEERAEAAASKLVYLLEKEKLFLSPDLTLQKLAGRLNIHYNHLSRIINERFGLSYNDFINKYRIEEAKKRLTDPGEKDTTILDIIYSTGFYSKSVFNSAFKKNTGTTPSEYRKKGTG